MKGGMGQGARKSTEGGGYQGPGRWCRLPRGHRDSLLSARLGVETRKTGLLQGENGARAQRGAQKMKKNRGSSPSQRSTAPRDLRGTEQWGAGGGAAPPP